MVMIKYRQKSIQMKEKEEEKKLFGMPTRILLKW